MGFGIYIHIPYCVKKCPYCDFNSYGVGKLIPEVEYTEALLAELGIYSDAIARYPLTSIFFGGGTPSLFSSESIGRVINKILGITSPSDSLEVSIEVNPKTADLGKLLSFKEAGVNRVSLGVQSFAEKKLEFLGRINSPEDSMRILADVIKAGFENFNADLMYGCSFETPEEWRSELDKLLGFNTTHVSAYCLTIEDDTEFAGLYSKGKLILPDEETLSDMISLTGIVLAGAGYNQYEISNFAKPGFECRHNMLYWRGENYIGIGAGAHSHLDRCLQSEWGARWGNEKNPSAYIKRVIEGNNPVAFMEILDRQTALKDRVLMGLRLGEGIDLGKIEDRFSVSLMSRELDYLISDEFIELSDNRVSFNKKGLLVSNSIIYKILEAVAY
ncbi:MAG TPA: radical SAM family heme chaperone HemW [Thermodesulfobacteriota bacterium]